MGSKLFLALDLFLLKVPNWGVYVVDGEDGWRLSLRLVMFISNGRYPC